MAAPTMLNAPRGKALFYPYPEDLIVIGVDTPHKEGEHPYWDARCFLPLDEAMVLNIMAIGVRKAVEAEPDAERRGIIVEGRRRTLHAREANRRLVAQGQPRITIPVLAERNSEAEGLFKMISGNEFTLAETTVSRAKKAAMMLNRGVPYDQVALAFGKSIQAIKGWEKIAQLPQDLMDAVDAGTITATAALALAAKPAEERKAFLAEEPTEDPAVLAAIEAMSGSTDTTDVAVEEAPSSPTDDKVKTKRAKKAAKIAKAKKKKTAAAAKGLRGKKFYKMVVDDFGDYLPPEFVLGVQFAHSLIEDTDLPPKIRTQILGAACMGGEIDIEQLPPGIARQLKKMYTVDDS